MDKTQEDLIRGIVRNQVKGFAVGFQDRHMSELDDPDGVINSKVHNIFIAALGDEVRFYSSLVRSLDSSLGSLIESMALAIAETSHSVLAQGLIDMGIIKMSLEEAMDPAVGLHKRWTLHGVSHMLGMDVHDCAQARTDQYRDGILEAGMVLTVEPGLYIQPDDELFAPEYRGIGIRIEDDVLVTENGCFNLSENIPRHPDEIEAWMASLR